MTSAEFIVGNCVCRYCMRVTTHMHSLLCKAASKHIIVFAFTSIRLHSSPQNSFMYKWLREKRFSNWTRPSAILQNSQCSDITQEMKHQKMLLYMHATYSCILCDVILPIVLLYNTSCHFWGKSDWIWEEKDVYAEHYLNNRNPHMNTFVTYLCT